MPQNKWCSVDLRTSHAIYSRNQTAMQVAFLQPLFYAKLLSGLFYTDTMVYEPVGCFNDQRGPRALPQLVGVYPVNNTALAKSLAAVIQACATKAYKNGFWYFGVEYRRECWSGVNGSMTYNIHGPSDKCIWKYKVGAAWTIFVYRFVEG